jgi:hypothetical protein
MLAALLQVPKTDADWSVWSYAHRDSHNIIRQAIQAKTGINLNDYPLDPIDLSQFSIFTNYNQQAHNAFNGVLKTQGTDLSQVDLSDANQLEAWVWLHYQEHYTASAALGVS